MSLGILKVIRRKVSEISRLQISDLFFRIRRGI